MIKLKNGYDIMNKLINKFFICTLKYNIKYIMQLYWNRIIKNKNNKEI